MMANTKCAEVIVGAAQKKLADASGQEAHHIEGDSVRPVEVFNDQDTDRSRVRQ